MPEHAPLHRPGKWLLMRSHQRNRQHGSGVARVNDAVIPQPRRREVWIGFFFDLRLQHLFGHRLFGFVNRRCTPCVGKARQWQNPCSGLTNDN